MIEEKKYIKIVTYGNFPFGGSAANLLRNLSLSIAKQNQNVEVILPTGNYFGDKIDANTKRNGHYKNIRYRHLGFIHHPKNYFGKFLDIICGAFLPIIYLYKESFKNKLDTIILFDTSLTTTLPFLFIKKTLNKKFIVIIPDFYEKPKSRFISFPLIQWFNFYVGFKYLVRYSDSFIVASFFLQRYLLDVLKVKKSILVLPNLIDPDDFLIPENQTHVADKITIGYAGTPTRKDGVMDLIESFGILNKKYPKTHLLIIGDIVGGSSIIPPLKDLALKLGVLENITFTGLVSFTRIPVLLNSCDILALTRPNGVFAEAGFPTKLGEYFVCRKPVIITRVGDIPVYFNNEEHVIIVNPEDPENIVMGFEKLLNDSVLCDILCNNAYKWMEENLNYKNMSTKLCEFIERE